mmetsp:Transcript_86788/g.194097  ORF Transcript_86788/g.194097 Transcript_86788/m.194097 type:complete len:106 (-) Transcript_86788:30-347(-)
MASGSASSVRLAADASANCRDGPLMGRITSQGLNEVWRHKGLELRPAAVRSTDNGRNESCRSATFRSGLKAVFTPRLAEDIVARSILAFVGWAETLLNPSELLST